MSVTTFWGDVAECRRLLRHYRQVQDDVKNRSPLRRFVRRVWPWAIIPLLALPWWHLLGISYWFGLGLLFWVLVTPLSIHPPSKLTTFEALHMPSRRSLYMARLEPSLRWLLWGGLWGTAGLLLAFWGAVRDVEQAVLYLLIGAQVPWLVLGLLGTITLLWRIWGGKVLVRALLVCYVFIVLLGILLPLFDLKIGFKPAQAFNSHLDLIAPVMLVVEVGLLALQVWALDWLEPMYQINPLMRTQLDLQLAQQKALATKTPRSRGVPGKVGPAPMLAGRHGLGWASAYYACFKLWEGGPRGFLGRLFQSGMLLLPLLMGSIETWTWIVMASFLFSSAASGSVVQSSNSQRLYLLGVDYRCQLVHRLKTFWITPAVPMVTIVVVVAWTLWGKPDIALALLALWAGLTLLAEGCFGWPTLATLWNGRPIGCLVLGLVPWGGLLAWVDLGLGSTATRVQLFAATCGALGLASILYKWWRFDEDRLAEALAAAQPHQARLAELQRSRTGGAGS